MMPDTFLVNHLNLATQSLIAFLHYRRVLGNWNHLISIANDV